ncbi:uncharacterized protein BDR25DRAFT_316129 [Lindgomyces ingoldianus]|uniref:Uncharacterized protein n=1 Tax=Lindgomyces ingoldianus TaxID=673940 RepID=A0ACB6QQ94_9PLEO|nr:uncharacterized protein BDR25DRAFT_316129 [Lindgomyces ingoldianus]KAF2468336.1 hypothetical protein BDR25DRAFT_316129 [Lindgomyces ingoldianus]
MFGEEGGSAPAAADPESLVEADAAPTPRSLQNKSCLKLRYLSESPASITYSLQTCPRLSSWPRRLLVKLRSGSWIRNSHVVVLQDGDDITSSRAVVTMFDTGCRGRNNLISTRALTKIFGLKLEYAEERIIATYPDGRACLSVGEIDIRWWPEDGRPRYEFIRAYVLESNEFDLIVGEETIENYLGQLPLFGAFMSKPVAHNAATVAKEQLDADARREDHRSARQRRKEQTVGYPKSPIDVS